MKITMTKNKGLLKKTGNKVKSKSKREILLFLRSREETTEKNREQVSSSANIWERVVNEIDIKSAKTGYHTRDVSRMKELLLSLRKDASAPGNIIA